MEREQLISIIKNNIKNKEDLIKNTEIVTEELNTLISQFTTDINQVDINILTKVLNHLNKDNRNYDINKEIKYFKVIQFISKNNENLSSKYKLTNEQKEYIKNLLSTLKNQINIENKNNYRIRDIQSKINKTRYLLSKISNNNEYTEEIDLINEILEEEQIDYETRYNILVYILKQNKELFISRQEKTKITNVAEERPEIIETKVEETPEDKSTKIKAIFEKHARNFNEIDIEFQEQLIQYGDLNNIEQMLRIVISIGLKENNPIFSLLLLYSNKEIFNNIQNISKESNILMKDLLKYPGIFLQTTPFQNIDKKELDIHKPIPSYNSFINNYNNINKLGFNFKEVYENLSAEITGNCDTIISNLKLTRLYKIPASTRRKNKEYSYSSMNKKETFQKIDRYIELGLYDYIKDNISVNGSEEKIAKIKYALDNSKDYPDLLRDEVRPNGGYTKVINATLLETVSTQIAQQIKSTWISTDILKENNETLSTYRRLIKKSHNDTINLDLISNNNIIRLLEKNYKKDEVTYNIDGVLISRLKVLRIFTTLYNNGYTDADSLMYAILYNSLITQEQLDKIQNFFINSYTRGGRA